MITPSHLHTLWSYKDLIIRLAWSDFKLRYKSSALGFIWSLLEPLLMLVVLYEVFTNLMRVQVPHYQLFLLLGIIIWNFLDRGTSMSIWGITGKPSLVQKVYFPRDILVISSCTTALMMSLLELVVLVVFMAIFRVMPSIYIAYFPFVFLFEFLITLGLSLALSALNVYFRDTQFIWRVVMQIGFYATPILYPITIFPPTLQRLGMLNPMASIVTMLRDCTLYGRAPDLSSLAYVMVFSFIVLFIGYAIFDRMEPKFAEVI